MQEMRTRSPMERGDPGPGLHDQADPLVAEDTPWATARDIPLEDVQVGAADRRLDDLYNGVGRRFDLGHRALLQLLLARPLVDECLHHRPLASRRTIGAHSAIEEERMQRSH